MKTACGILVLCLLICTLAWRYQDLPMVECAWCHHKSTLLVGLNRHHVIPQATAPELRDVETNLVVLCRRCHFVLGHRCDWKKANPDVRTILVVYTNSLPNVRTHE